jgi:hypothetical protein
MELLERENAFLREQVKIKDQQIADQTERSRETDVLFNGLQRMLRGGFQNWLASRRATRNIQAA